MTFCLGQSEAKKINQEQFNKILRYIKAGREKGIYSLQNYLQVKSIVSPLKLFSLQAHVILYITDSLLNLETHTMLLEVELA